MTRVVLGNIPGLWCHYCLWVIRVVYNAKKCVCVREKYLEQSSLILSWPILNHSKHLQNSCSVCVCVCVCARVRVCVCVCARTRAHEITCMDVSVHMQAHSCRINWKLLNYLSVRFNMLFSTIRAIRTS